MISIFQSNERLEQEKDIIGTIIQNNIAGVIGSISMETNEYSHLMELKKYNIPLVLFDRVCDINVPKITINNQEIIFQSVEYLVEKGYRKIAHITGTNILNVFRERQLGYSGGCC